ncbi:hypothetical protein, partial [Chishuiella sp.]|uniref:hypothetical protein n=1 Tax=Chishuiella sp. TaxID=1969467 RepID=UPI0028AB66EB
WIGRYIFYYDVFRNQEHHTFDLILDVGLDFNVKMNFDIDDIKSDTVVKGFIEDNKFIIRYVEFDQDQEYILKQDKDGGYLISGKSIYILNPPNDEFDIRKESK